MLRVLLIRPGATEYDEQLRVTGTLDIPLCENGIQAVQQLATELQSHDIQAIYSSPCKSAVTTADMIARGREIKNQPKLKLKNLDHGLWQGKLVSEIKQTQPKVYKQWHESPEKVCPPGGESLSDAQLRVEKVFKKIQKKHKEGCIALVMVEPIAAILRSVLLDTEVSDLWKNIASGSYWEMIEVETQTLVSCTTVQL